MSTSTGVHGCQIESKSHILNATYHKVGALVEAEPGHPVLQLLRVAANLLARRGGTVVAADLEAAAEVGLLVLAPVGRSLPWIATSA
jgi:hypothetical protein